MIYYAFEWNSVLMREAEALSERGHHVDIICIGQHNIGKMKYNEHINIYKIQKRSFNEKNKISYLVKYARFFILCFLLTTILHVRHRYNVVHVTSPPDIFFFTSIFMKLTGAKIILDIHDITPEFYMRKFGANDDDFLIRVLKLIERTAVRLSDHVFTVTHIWRSRILRRTGIKESKCTVMMNMPNMRVAQEKSNKKDFKSFRLFYPGALGEHFGVETLIRAMPLIRKQIPSVRLDVYGDGALKKELINLTYKFRLDSSVVFHPPVDHKEILKIMKEVDLGVVPTKDGVFAGEALSTKALEFMDTGIPVVISSTKISRYYFDNSMVMFFEASNPRALADAVIELYGNPERREELVRNAHCFSERHSWEHYKRIYYRVIDNLCLNGNSKNSC